MDQSSKPQTQPQSYSISAIKDQDYGRIDFDHINFDHIEGQELEAIKKQENVKERISPENIEKLKGLVNQGQLEV